MRVPRASILAAASLIAMAGGWASGQGQPGPPPSGTTTAFLAGQVLDYPSGRPVPQATVLMITRGAPAAARGGQRGQPPVVADSQGRFFFAELPAGTYSVQVTKTGYMAAAPNSFSRTIELGDGERILDLRPRLSRLVSLAGAVRDDAGDPVVGTTVIAIRRTLVNGRLTLQPGERAQTDDRGIYRLANLRPGEYVLCACTRDPIPFDGRLLTSLASEPLQLMTVAMRALMVGGDVATLDDTLRTFAPGFYPASTTVARATRITAAPGDDKTGLDITLEPVRATPVSGTVVGAPSPVLASSIRLVPAGESEEGAAVASLVPMLVQPDGRFDFSGVPPGQYTLRILHAVFAPGSGAPSGAALTFLGNREGGGGSGGAFVSVGSQLDEPPLWAAESITVGDAGTRGLSIALRRATKISGRVEFVGSAPPPNAQVLTRAGVLAQPMNPDPARAGGGGLGRVIADATFQVRGVMPGRYTLSALSVPGWPTLKSIVIAGIDVTDLPLDVEVTDVNDVVVTFTDAPLATLSGTMTGGQRGSGDDVSVVVFPTDQRYWTDPQAAIRRFRSAPISRRASFTVPGLPAGEYFVSVVIDALASEWQEAGRLAALARNATRVTVADGDKKTIEVRR